MKVLGKVWIVAGLIAVVGQPWVASVAHAGCEKGQTKSYEDAKGVSRKMICVDGNWKKVTGLMHEEDAVVDKNRNVYKLDKGTGEWSFCKDCAAINGRVVPKAGGSGAVYDGGTGAGGNAGKGAGKEIKEQ